MHYNARVMIVDRTGADSKLVAAVQSQGFDAITAGLAGLSPDQVSDADPDLVVIDNQGDIANGLDLTRALKASPKTEEVPMVLINSDMSAASQASSIDAGADDVIGPPINEIALGFRVRSLVRLEVMRSELMRRRDTLERFAIDVPPADLDHMNISDARVLIVGTPLEMDSLETLEEAFAVDSENDPMVALSRLAGMNYSAVIVLASPETVDKMVEFCTDVRRNVSYFNLPVLLVLPSEAEEAATTAHDIRVSGVLFQPLDILDLRQQALVWIRHWRYRGNLIAAARSTKSIVTIDPVTELSTRAFLLDYMTNLVTECQAHDRTFSVGYFKLPEVEAINQEFGYAAGEHLLRQVGQIVKRLVRVEDMGARYRPTELCVLLPHTSGDSVPLVVERVASIVRNTEFLLMGCTHAMRPLLEIGWTEYQSGDSAQSVLDRAGVAVR
ncbi:MAG: diguanylate cyclase [Alphaproteobacteria bacterium]